MSCKYFDVFLLLHWLMCCVIGMVVNDKLSPIVLNEIRYSQCPGFLWIQFYNCGQGSNLVFILPVIAVDKFLVGNND